MYLHVMVGDHYMVTFKVNPKVLSSTTKKWVSSGTGSKGTSFKVTAAPKSTALSSGVSKSSFSTSDRLLQQKISTSSLMQLPFPREPLPLRQ